MKKFLTTLVFMSFLISSFAQVSWILEPSQESNQFITPGNKYFAYTVVKFEDGDTKLVDKKGKTIIEKDHMRWDNAFAFSGHFFIVNRVGEPVEYYNKDLKNLCEGYDCVGISSIYKYVRTKKNDLLGLLDFNGNVILEHKYDYIHQLEKCKLEVVTPDGKSHLITLKDQYDPKKFMECEIGENKTYMELSVNCVNPINLGIIDINNDTILHHSKYFSVMPFGCPRLINDTLIFIKSINTDKKGLINFNGKLIVDTIYKNIYPEPNSPHLLTVTTDTTSGVLNLKTNKVSTYGFDKSRLTKHWIYIEQGKFKGTLDLNGKVIIPPIFDRIYMRLPPYAIGVRNDSFFVYSIKKQEFAKDIFTKFSGSRNVFPVQSNNKYRLFDGINLKYKTDTIYDHIESIKDYFECRNTTYDTIHHDPPQVRKNSEGIVYGIYKSSLKPKHTYHYLDLNGDLVYTTINMRLKVLNDTFSKHYISGTDSVAFVNTKTFQAQKFLRSKVDNPKYGHGKIEKGVIAADSNHYILEHYLDPNIDAIPYQSLTYDEEREIYIYEVNNKFGLLEKDSILTKPIFEDIKKRSVNQYVVKLKGKYGICQVKLKHGIWKNY